MSDYTPVHYSAVGIPYKTSAVNVQAGLVLTFGCKKKKIKYEPVVVEDTLPEPAQTEAPEEPTPVAEEPATAE